MRSRGSRFEPSRAAVRVNARSGVTSDRCFELRAAAVWSGDPDAAAHSCCRADVVQRVAGSPSCSVQLRLTVRYEMVCRGRVRRPAYRKRGPRSHQRASWQGQARLGLPARRLLQSGLDRRLILRGIHRRSPGYWDTGSFGSSCVLAGLRLDLRRSAGGSRRVCSRRVRSQMSRVRATKMANVIPTNASMSFIETLLVGCCRLRPYQPDATFVT